MWTIWHLLLDNLQRDLKVIYKSKGKGKHQVENRDLDRGILSFVTKPQALSNQTDLFKLSHRTRVESKVPQEPPDSGAILICLLNWGLGKQGERKKIFNTVQA